MGVGGTGVSICLDPQLVDIADTVPDKGTLLVGDGTNYVTLIVGTDGKILSADSTEDSGVKWITASGTGDLLSTNNLSDVASAATSRTNLGLAIGSDVQAYSSILANTTASFLTADETKLDGIEAGADVTDATNVAAAGAVMEGDTTTASMSFVIDEDNMSSNLATKVPTQQSVKAYADTKLPATNPVITGSITEDVYALSGTTPALEPDNGTVQTWTLTGNSTPTDAFSDGQSITLMVADGTAYTINWPTMTWVGGSSPELATTGYSVIVLWKVGSTLYGCYLGVA